MSAMQDSSSLPSFLMLGALTSLANQSLTLVEGAREQLGGLSGLVVRLRVDKPSLVVYALLHDDGVEFLQQYEGKVDIRVRTSLGALLQYLLLPDGNGRDDIRIQGDETRINALRELLDYCSFWAVARGWLDHYMRFNELLSLLGREDPAWLARLEGLPDNMQQLAHELAQQRLLQEDILEELGQLRRQLSQQRRVDMATLVIGLLLLFAALATLNGNLPQLLLHQAAILASAGGALLLSRLVAPG